MEQISVILPLGAWFLGIEDMRTQIPTQILDSIVGCDQQKDDLMGMNTIWSNPEKDLPDTLKQSYGRLQSLQNVRDWCKHSY